MRELVYLSDNKLRQFVPERRRSRIGRRLTAIRFTTPVGGLDLETAGDPDTQRQKQEHLAAVVRHVEEQALWFQDPDARAGQWVYFEAPLNVLVSDVQPDTIMFIDPDPGTVKGYEQPHGARLLLHGSSSHLLTGELTPVPLPAGPFRRSELSAARFTLTVLSHVAPPTVEELDDPHGGPPLHGDTMTMYTVRRLIKDARRFAPTGSAAWMRGYARVTATTKIYVARDVYAPCLIATPLFVEYATDLP